jgi:putative membrane protein
MIPGYASILHNHLKDEETSQQLFDGVDLEIDHHKHKPNQVAKMLFQKINDLYDSKK